MSVDELLRSLRERNVDLWVEGKLLRFRAPDGVLDNTLLIKLRKHKSELVNALAGKAERKNDESRLEALSIGQQALYFLHSIAPRSPAYNCASAARICSAVDIEAMRGAFDHLLARHDSLRTTFEIQDGRPQRRIRSRGRLDFRQITAAGWDETKLNAAVREEYERPFDLKTGPLLRVRLFSLSETDHVFLMFVHHIVFDAWSLWLVQDEFRLLYQQHAGGQTALLPLLEKTYSNFIEEQTALQTSKQGERLWAYWKERLAGKLAPLDIPLDRPRVELPHRRGATHRFRIPGTLAVRLRELAASHDATPFMVMLAIFKTWLHRATGQTDLIVGTATSGRTVDYHCVVGYFVNTLAIRTDLSAEPTFVDFLAHVKSRTVEALDHHAFPFPLLVNRLNPRRDSGRLPICNAMFGLHKPQRFSEVTRLFDEESGHIDWGGLEVRPFELDQQEGQFDLTLEFLETNDSYLGTLKYDLDLFDTSTAERMGRHFVRLAERIVEDPSRPLSGYDFLSNDERERVVGFGASERVAFSGNLPVHGLMERQAERVPDHVAVVCDDEELTYSELNRRANQMARLLRSRGVEVGTLVACHLERGIDVPVALLAILKAGGVYVPLETQSPAHRVRQIVLDSGARFVITNSGSAFVFESNSDLELLLLEQCGDAISRCSDSSLDIDLPADALAYVIHTSGSTGMPKGVCISHRAFAEHILSVREVFGLAKSDRMLQFSNFTFDPSLEQMFGPWSCGATVVLRGNYLWPADEFWQVVRRHQVTVANLPPAYFKQVSDSLDRAGGLADSLRLLIVGGDVFPVETLKAWKGRCVRVLNAYGPTEATVTATVYDVPNRDSTTARMPIGRPIPGVRAYVVDGRDRHAPIGIPGELCLGGPMLAEGYLNDPEQTAESFVADPFSPEPGARMYRTGDRVRWTPDGDLEFLGRADRQIKIDGQRIETGEIENVLNSCPYVRESVVQAREDAAGDAYLVAWFVGVGDAETDRNRLREFLRSRLPRLMVPRQFVPVDRLPVNPAGKIDTHQLPEPPDTRPSSDDYVAPRTETERLLVEIWASVLNVDSVGVHDDFFDFGGGSLTSLRIVARASEAGLELHGAPLTPELLFEYPNVGELAAFLESAES